jgi:hypothetical protein
MHDRYIEAFRGRRGFSVLHLIRIFALYIGLGSICYTVGAFAAPLVAPLTSTFKLVFGTQAAPAIASTAAATMPFAYTDSNFVTAGCLAIVSLGECLTGGYGHTGG